MFSGKIFKKMAAFALCFSMLLPSTFAALGANTAVVKIDDINNVTVNSAAILGSFDVYGEEKEPDYVGFVYSTAPLKDSSILTDGTPVEVQPYGTTYNITLNGLEDNTTYYVRAYARYGINSYYFSPEQAFTTKSSLELPTVKTTSVEWVRSDIYIATAEITKEGEIVTESDGSDNKNEIKSIGFAYSTSNKAPTVDDQTIEMSGIPIGIFNANITVSSSSTCFVRAYVKTDLGVSYGETITVSNSGKVPAVTTSGIADVLNTSAIVTVNLTNPQGTVSERGVIISATDSEPKFSSSSSSYSSASVSGGDTGSVNVTIEGLTPDTVYYVRAYAKNSDGYGYGEVYSIRTLANDVTLYISYMYNNKRITTETVSTYKNNVLTVDDLQEIPEGYVLAKQDWSYTATTNETVNVTLALPGTDVDEDGDEDGAEEGVSNTEKEYIAGLGNYTFGPEDNATREQIAQVIYNLYAASHSAASSSAESIFPDVDSYSKYYSAIQFCASNGYMNGDDKGNFNPKDGINRAEMATVLCNYYGLSGSADNPFEDTEGHWAANFVALAYEAGIISGYEDGTFRPDDNVSRAEVCALFANAENRSLEPLQNETVYIDVAEDAWYYKYIMNASIPTK